MAHKATEVKIVAGHCRVVGPIEYIWLCAEKALIKCKPWFKVQCGAWDGRG